MRKIIPLVFLSLFMVSCGLHPPISEALVFDDDPAEYSPKIYGDEIVTSFYGSSRRTSPIVISHVGIGLSKTNYSAHYKRLALEKNEKNRFNEFDENFQTGLLSLGVARKISKDFMIGFNPGIILLGAGIDATFRIGDMNFLTVEGNLYKSYEAILQRRLFLNKNVGFSFGVFYRHEVMGDEYNWWSGTDYIQSDIAGIRYLFNLGNQRSSIRGFASYGIEREFDTQVFFLGLSLAGSKSDRY